MSNPPPCVRCKHHAMFSRWAPAAGGQVLCQNNVCRHPTIDNPEEFFNMITGKITVRGADILCSKARNDETMCGNLAKLYEPNWFARIFGPKKRK